MLLPQSLTFAMCLPHVPCMPADGRTDRKAKGMGRHPHGGNQATGHAEVGSHNFVLNIRVCQIVVSGRSSSQSSSQGHIQGSLWLQF
jgi:hypothetical protein